MKIKVRILFQAEAKPALRETGLFSKDEIEDIVLELDAQSDHFAEFMQATRDVTEGSWLNPVMTFTRKELDSADFFQLDCRKTLEENNKDYAWNENHVESLALIKTPANREILLPERIAVSRVKALKPHMAAGLGQWLQEYIVTDQVAAAFARAKLTGYELRPLYSGSKETAHENVHQLYSSQFMPPAMLDRTTPAADGGGLNQLGCLTYSDLDKQQLADFNRTAEDWAMGKMPLWVVSSAVRDCFLRHKFRGWAFRPVLVKGSEMHRQYEDMWKELFDKVSINPLNFF